MAGWGKDDEVVADEAWGAGDELADTAARPLPKGVAPSTAGAGRGSQGGPTAEELRLASARRGTARGVLPYVAADPPAEDQRPLLERPVEGYQDTDERAPWKRGADTRQAIDDARRQTLFATSRMAPSDRGVVVRALDSTLRRPGDESAAGGIVETIGDAARGVARGSAGFAGSVFSAAQAAGDTLLGETAAGNALGEMGRAARAGADALGNPVDRNSLTQQVFESTFLNAVPMATLGFGNAALLAMGAQAAAADYGESRDAGLSNAQALERAPYMGAAEIIGERFSLPALGQLFAKAAAKVSTRELGHVLADILVKEQIGEQVTTAMQDAYEKAGIRGRKPDMTLADYIDDAANTAKVALGQSLLMGGAAASVRALPQSRDQQIAGAIDQGVAGTFFTRAGINNFVLAAQDPNSPVFDPAAVRPEDTRVPGSAPAAAASVAPAAPPVRMEDMPSDPISPETVTALAGYGAVQAAKQRAAETPAASPAPPSEPAAAAPAPAAAQVDRPAPPAAAWQGLVDRAEQFVRTAGTSSAAALQRHLRVGNSTAVAVLSELRRRGAIAEPAEPAHPTIGSTPDPARAQPLGGAEAPVSRAVPAQPADGRWGAGDEPAQGQHIDQGRADGQNRAADARGPNATGRAPSVPGSPVRGSLAAAAQRALQARQVPVGQAAEEAAQPTGAQAERSELPAPGATSKPLAQDAAPAAAGSRDREAGRPEPKPSPAAPTFETSALAVEHAARHGMWSTHQPAQGADARWRLQSRHGSEPASGVAAVSESSDPAAALPAPQSARAGKGVRHGRAAGDDRAIETSLPSPPDGVADSAYIQGGNALQGPAPSGGGARGSEHQGPSRAEPDRAASPATPPVVAAPSVKRSDSTPMQSSPDAPEAQPAVPARRGSQSWPGVPSDPGGQADGPAAGVEHAGPRPRPASAAPGQDDRAASMPLEDFLGRVEYRHAGSGARPWSAWLGVRRSDGGRGAKSRRDAVAAARAFHAAEVARAVDAGRRLAPDVLRDYREHSARQAGGAPWTLGIGPKAVDGRSLEVPTDAGVRVVDAGKLMRSMEQRWDAARSGRIENSADVRELASAEQRHRAAGAEADRARRLAIADVLDGLAERIALVERLVAAQLLGRPVEAPSEPAESAGRADATDDQRAQRFQRTEAEAQAVAAALKALRENDDLFALPRSRTTTVEDIAADIDPQIKVRRTAVSSLETMWRLTLPNGGFALLIERKPNPFGPRVYDYRTEGGEDVPVTERPGDNPEDLSSDTEDVYIDASHLKPGGGGTKVYAIASTYAHNTGRLFIGYPAGLSDDAMRRRPEQMLSSALKFGTTDHLAPHPRQVRGDAALGVPPLRWVYGDTEGNIRRLVDVNLAALKNAVPDADLLVYDATARRFTNTRTGVSRGAADEELLAGLHDGRRAVAGTGLETAGRRTLARGAVLRALVREEGREGAAGGRRDGLLARLAGIGDDPGAAGLFYSRAGDLRGAGDSTDHVASPHRLTAVAAAVERVAGTWANAPEIEVLPSLAFAPAVVRDADAAQRAAGATGVPSAFMLGGRVYLVASQLGSDDAVASAVLHEAVGHLGLRGVFGAELGKVLDEVAALREADVRAKASAYGLSYADTDQRRQAAEEVLAELAQTDPKLTLVQRAIAAIRAWLRAHIPMLSDLALTDSEIVARFISPARRFIAEGEERHAEAGEPAAAFDRRSDNKASAAAFKAWLGTLAEDHQSRVHIVDSGRATRPSTVVPAQPTARAPLPATLQVDGVERSTRNSLGAAIGAEEDAVRAFWRWFGESKLVDAQGRPQVLFHGTSRDFVRFRASTSGLFGAGIYLADTPDLSEFYSDGFDGGDQMLAVYARMVNPYRFDGADFTLPAGYKGLVHEVINPSAALADAILPPNSAKWVIEKIAHGWSHFGEVYRKRLTELGYDGIIASYANIDVDRYGFDHPEYIAFCPQQIKSAIGNVGTFSSDTADLRYQRTASRPAAFDELTNNANSGPFDLMAVVPQPTQTETPAFRRWFGQSKVVDADGRPLVVYLGGVRDVTQFDAAGDTGLGVFLTPDRSEAGHEARGRAMLEPDAAASVMPLFVSMQRPRVLGAEAFNQRAIDAAMRDPTADGVIALAGDGGIRSVIPKRPDQVKSAIGNVGFFDPSSADIRFQRATGDEGQDEGYTLRPFGRAARAVEVLQDRYNRWKHAIDAVREQGGTVNDDNDFYRAEERYWGQVGSRIEAFKDELQAFVKAVAEDGLTVDDVARYAYAQHAEERNEWIAGRNPDMPDGGSGMTTEEADDILQAAHQAGVEQELRRHAATLRSWIQGTRDVLRDGGLIDQRTHGAWGAMFQHYVPLRGLEAPQTPAADASASPSIPASQRRGGIRGEEAVHAVGRRTPARQIVEQIVNDRARALVRVGRNEVLRSFAQFVLDNPDPKLWEVNAVERRSVPVADASGHIHIEHREALVDDDRTITLKDDGHELHILVHDPKLLEQLKRLGVQEHPIWPIASLLFANRVLSRLYTSLNPVFTVTNFVRDVQAATFGVIDEVGLMAAPRLLAKLPAAMLQSINAEAGGKKSHGYQVFEALGGKTAFFNLKGLDDQARELEHMVAAADRSALDPRELLGKALGVLEAANGAVENATRLAAFEVAVEAGRTTVQAASIAKNITVNFNRRGTQNLASAWVLFFNPAVQGTARIVQSLAHPKVQATIGLAMLGMAALALRNAGMGDDDDGVAWWDKVPDDVKERNIVIVLPPGAKAGQQVPGSKLGRYVKVPMPYGYSFFAVLANQVVDTIRHGADPKRGRTALDASIKAFGAFTGSWLPAQDIGRAVSPEGGAAAGKSAAMVMVPDAVDPLFQVWLNQGPFGRALRPEGKTTRAMPDSADYFPAQHGTLWQRGAAALNAGTGGSTYRPGAVDLAPSTLENLARAYGGAPLGFGLDLVNAFYLRQTIERPEMEAKKLPFLRQFWGVIDAETDRMTGYQRLDDTDRVLEPIRRAQRDGAASQAVEMTKDAGFVAGLGSAVLETRHSLGEIIKAERQAIDDARLTDGERYLRLVQLGEQRRRALQAFTRAYDKAVEATEEKRHGR